MAASAAGSIHAYSPPRARGRRRDGEDFERDPAIGHGVPERSQRCADDNVQRRAGQQRRVAVREVEHAAHELARFAPHQHAAGAIGDEVERDAQLARGQLRLRMRQLVDAIADERRAVTRAADSVRTTDCAACRRARRAPSIPD